MCANFEPAPVFRPDADDRFLEFTGLRDGEKLSEHLTYDYESLEETTIPQIHGIRGNAVLDADEFADSLGDLLDLVVDRRKPGLVKAMSWCRNSFPVLPF